MIGVERRYVVDTNALSQLKRHRRASEYFQDHAVIPSEVLHESQGFPDYDELRANLYPTTSRLLDWLLKVMASVPVDDNTLINLYANLGGADPFVVACALDGAAQDSKYIDAPDWIVVTGDVAVRKKATEFNLKVLTGAEFAAIIDAAERK